ncbi:probable cinnamyl alcohol dehydrogenase 9 [Zingiber officinale]|uniref:cinnamyl-alcohol dehydrogenase n=1 Tax=Zingiber officinale TaxID=94328 RepID=A0A8J5HFR5_ZINOF|nr:probable cinnamyl alcohol dehydrogenase 9 [Zingiber officinale]KAG6515360.1 hypothetical protein ZIOFF_025772 [Zingiber officinale]
MEEQKQEEDVVGWAARDTSGVLFPFTFPKRAMKSDEITLKVLYCGICHTDLSVIKNEWGNAIYPVVPGHEVVGVVIEVGRAAHKFKSGDKVGVGYLAGSCFSCDSCEVGDENYCAEFVRSFNSSHPDGTKTFGGFAGSMVISERFAVKIPETMPLDKAAPLMCAGVTVYAPMKRHGLDQPGLHLGVLGLGGLGHLAVKFGKAFGMRVTVISSTPDKEKEAIDGLGADSFIVSSNEGQMKAARGTMDGIISTSSGALSLGTLITLLRVYGKLILVGSPNKPPELPTFGLISGGRSVAGSMIGGLKETQEMLDFAAEHRILPMVEVVGMNDVNDAMQRLARGDVRYRFVIDVANTICAT